MREVHLHFVYDVDDDELDDDDAARLAGDMMYEYVMGEVFDSEHPSVDFVRTTQEQRADSIVFAALTTEALNELADWHNKNKNLPAPDYWDQSPRQMEILRDIFRGYVVGRDVKFIEDADAWTEAGLTADGLLLDALDRINNWAPYCVTCNESIDTPEGEPCGGCGEPNPRGEPDA